MISFMDGFEQFKGITNSTELAAAGYVTTGPLAVADGRSAGSTCVAIGGGTNPASLARTFNSGASKVVIAFAYFADTARSNIIDITNGFSLEWPDKLQINGSKGTVIPVLGVWYYYELVVDKVNQQIQVYINNVLDLTVAMPAAMQNLSVYECKWAAPASNAKRLDDVFFITSGTPNPVDRVGPQAISIRLPDADVTKEWSAATGDNHFAMANNRPADETKYVQSATSGAMDLFTSSVAPATGAITAVGVVVRARKSDIDNRQVGILIGAKGATQKETLVTSLQTTPTYNYAVFPTDPAGAAWTDSSIGSTPFGVVVRP